MVNKDELRDEFRAYMNESKCLVMDYFNKFKNDKYSNINVKKMGTKFWLLQNNQV